MVTNHLSRFWLRVSKHLTIVGGLSNWQTVTLCLSILRTKKILGRYYVEVEIIKIRYLQRAIGEPKTSVASNTHENVTEICASDMHIVNASMLCTEQKWTKHAGN